MTYSEFIESIEKAAVAMGDTDVLDILGKVILTDEVETMATNSYNIFVSPSFAASITPKQAVGVLVHEMMHDGLLHHGAVWSIYDPDSGIPRGRWYELANVAEDIVINEWLISHGYELPGDYCTRAKFTPPVKPQSTTSAEMFSDLVEYTKKQYKKLGDLPDWLKKLLEQVARLFADKQRVSKLSPKKPSDMSRGANSGKANKASGADKDKANNAGASSASSDEPEKDDQEEEENQERKEQPSNSQQQPAPQDEDDEEEVDADDDEYDDEEDVDDGEDDEESEDDLIEDDEDDEEDTEDDTTLEESAKKIAARASDLRDTLTVAKNSAQIEADSYVPVRQTWIDKIFLEMGRYLNYQMRERTYARPSRRPPQSLPGSDIVTPVKGTRQQGFSARAIFYLDVSDSMYTSQDLPNNIRAEIEKNSTKLRSTRSIVKPFANKISQTPLDVSQWIDKDTVHTTLGFGTNLARVVYDINAQVGTSEVYAIITDADERGTLDVDDIDKTKRTFIVTNHPELISGDVSRHNITIIPVASFERGA